jgi:hypothetical protein
VRVSEDAGNGNAKVRLSFPDWKEGRVASSTFEIPIVDPEPAAPTAESGVQSAADKK